MTDTATSTSISLTGGLDIGNGYIKGALRGADGIVDKFDLPAGVALVTSPVDLPASDAEAPEVMSADIFNQLDASFTSPLVSSSYRHLFGTRGLRAQSSRFEEFDVVRDVSKAQQELSKVFVLGLFAAKALREYVAAHNALPADQLTVTARVGLALPIDEYRDHRVQYATELKQAAHLVTIHNFDTPVSVKLIFEDVQVAAEGSSAQFAIRQGGVGLIKAMLADVRKRGYALEGLTPEAIHAAQNTVGIDIGEGTVNFPVYSDTKFNGDVSRTFKEGYGTVLLNAMPDLRKAGTPFKSRKKLADYLLSEPSAMKQQEYDKVAGIVAAQAELWCQQLAEEFGKVFDDVRYDTEVAYVYGGGSGPLREILHPLLLDRVGEAFPVLYLDPSYSRHLNREGLLIAATLVEQRDQTKKKQRQTIKNKDA